MQIASKCFESNFQFPCLFSDKIPEKDFPSKLSAKSKGKIGILQSMFLSPEKEVLSGVYMQRDLRKILNMQHQKPLADVAVKISKSIVSASFQKTRS